jgi:hypothetical protein
MSTWTGEFSANTRTVREEAETYSKPGDTIRDYQRWRQNGAEVIIQRAGPAVNGLSHFSSPSRAESVPR